MHQRAWYIQQHPHTIYVAFATWYTYSCTLACLIWVFHKVRAFLKHFSKNLVQPIVPVDIRVVSIIAVSNMSKLFIFILDLFNVPIAHIGVYLFISVLCKLRQIVDVNFWFDVRCTCSAEADTT